MCGEFISPGADPILEQLGVLASIEALVPKRLKGVAISSYESAELEMDYPVSTETGLRPSSLSVPRFQLDALFIKKVQSTSVKVFEQHKVTDFIFDNGCVAGVHGWDENENFLFPEGQTGCGCRGTQRGILKKIQFKTGT